MTIEQYKTQRRENPASEKEHNPKPHCKLREYSLNSLSGVEALDMNILQYYECVQSFVCFKRTLNAQ